MKTINPTKPNTRMEWVDYAKGFAIILVVYRHVLGGYSNEGFVIPEYLNMLQQSVYNIRMPLFFIIAGIFARKSIQKRTLNEFIRYKSSTILYPYFIWISIQLFIQIIFSGQSHADRSWSDFQYIFFNPFMLKDQFWFLYILFFVSVAFAVIQYYGKANCTLQLLIGIVLNYISQFLSFTPLEVFCYYYFFFVLGDFVSKALLNHYQKIGSVWVIAGLIPVFLLSQWYWISHPQLKEEFLLLFNLVAILGSAFILSMSVRLGDLQKLNWLKTVGKHSLYIYVMHVIVQAGIRELLVDIAKIETLTYLLFITVSASLILPIFTYRHSMKLNLWYLYSIENFKITKRKLTGTV